MSRVQVIDPYSGVTLDVAADSPQARAWGSKSAAVPVDADAGEASADSDKSATRKPGRPRKTD